MHFSSKAGQGSKPASPRLTEAGSHAPHFPATDLSRARAARNGTTGTHGTLLRKGWKPVVSWTTCKTLVLVFLNETNDAVTKGSCCTQWTAPVVLIPLWPHLSQPQ